jgi:hypothetical protein
MCAARKGECVASRSGVEVEITLRDNAMDAVLFGGEPIRDKSTMVERVVAYVRRFYKGEVKESLLRKWASRAVNNVWGDGPAVTSYVPMLALHDVRPQVLDHLQARMADGEALPPEAARDVSVWSSQRIDRDQFAVSPT